MVVIQAYFFWVEKNIILLESTVGSNLNGKVLNPSLRQHQSQDQGELGGDDGLILEIHRTERQVWEIHSNNQRSPESGFD